MMSLQTIRDLSAEQAELAAQENLVPFCFWNTDIEAAIADIESGNVPESIRRLPNLGDHVPPGYELVDTHFVDTHFVDACLLGGLWDAGGPALSIGEFVTKKLNNAHCYAIVSAGQFQVHIGEFSPPPLNHC